jgi:hypothetical protein
VPCQCDDAELSLEEVWGRRGQWQIEMARMAGMAGMAGMIGMTGMTEMTREARDDDLSLCRITRSDESSHSQLFYGTVVMS